MRRISNQMFLHEAKQNNTKNVSVEHYALAVLNSKKAFSLSNFSETTPCRCSARCIPTFRYFIYFYFYINTLQAYTGIYFYFYFYINTLQAYTGIYFYFYFYKILCRPILAKTQRIWSAVQYVTVNKWINKLIACTCKILGYCKNILQ